MTREEQIVKRAEEVTSRFSYRNGYSTAKDAFIEGAKFADANQPSPWISVEERLPEEHTDVIVTDGSNVAYCRKYGDGFYTNVGKCCNVTHWMPIPELPNEEKK